jgi:hypothetical protein
MKHDVPKPAQHIDEFQQVRYISRLAKAMAGSSWGSSYWADCHPRTERMSDCLCNAPFGLGPGSVFVADYGIE